MNVKPLLKKVSHIIPDQPYLALKFRLKMGYWMNFRNPRTFNEKLQWLKLHDRKPEYTIMVDKYEAKKYVASLIGEEYIVPTLGVWDSFEEIDFDALPDQFVLKCTHDSGGLVICRDKSKLDMEAARKKLGASLKHNYFWNGREWPYKNVRPRIIAERYMEDGCTSSLTDFKFFCFSGEPRLLYISMGMENHPTAQMSFYDMEGTEVAFHRSDYAQYHNAIIPDTFDHMKCVSQKLAAEIHAPFIRIDLYSIKGRVYFSEITFSPCGGMLPFEPMDADTILGEWLKI